MKRVAAGLMWLFLVTWAGNYLALYAGLPALVAPLAAVAVGAFVTIDPLALFWPTGISRLAPPQAVSRASTEIVIEPSR